jgi:hypothetical protein
MNAKTKHAAAIAAVIAYLRQEEDLLAAQATMMFPAPAAAGPVPLRLWGISGRQSQMQLRQTMQLRGFHGTRPR